MSYPATVLKKHFPDAHITMAGHTIVTWESTFAQPSPEEIDRWIAEDALETAIAAKDAEIEAERDRRMAAVEWIQNPGSTDEAIYQIKSTPDWIAFMRDLKSMLDRPAIAATFPRLWNGTIGPQPTLAVEEFLDMTETVFLGLDSIYQIAANHRRGLNALTTIEAVQTYSIWPIL